MSEYFDHFRVVITDGDRQWVKKVSSHDFFFGRLAPCDLILDASFISRKHGRIFIEDGSLWIEDLRSSNGVYVNGLKIRPNEKTTLPTQAIITFGENHKLSLVLDVILSSEEDSADPGDLKKHASLALNKFSNVVSDGLHLIRLKIEKKEKLIEQVKQESKEVIRATREERDALLEKAKQEAKKIVLDAQVIAEKMAKDCEAQILEQKKDAEKDLKKHHDNLESHNASLERIQNEIETYKEKLQTAQNELTDVEKKVQEKREIEKAVVDLKKQSQDELDVLARAKAELQSVQEKKNSLIAENTELALVPKKIEKEVDALKKEQSRLENQIKKSTDEKEHIQKFVDELIFERKELKSLIDEEKKEAKHEREVFQKDLENHKKKLLAEASDQCAIMIKEAEESSERMISQAKREVGQILEKARSEAEEQESKGKHLIKEAQSKAKDLHAQAEADRAERIEKATTEVDKIRSQLEDLDHALQSREKEFEAQIADRREQAVKSLEAELLEKKARELRELEVEHKNQEARFKEYMKSEAINIQQRLIETAAARMGGFLKSELSQEDKNRLDHVLKKATESILLGVDFDEKELEAHLKARPIEQQKKNKRFFAYALSGATLAAIVVFSMPQIFKQVENTAREVASSAKKEDQETIRQMAEQREILQRFEPEKSEKYGDEYLDSYTDRILYTRGYMEKELDPAFREKWILELNDHLLRELHINEDVVVAFIAREANLIRELQTTKESINGQYAEEGIQRMREIEKRFLDSVQKLAGSKKNLSKILDYKKSFYLR